MSTIDSTPNKGTRTERTEQFTDLSGIRVMTPERLAECRQPQRNLFELADDSECVVFAVAYRDGLVQNIPEQYEFEARAVLYLTADGEQAIESWSRATKSDLRDVERATLAPEDKLTDADDHAKRFGPVVRRHPEV